MSLVAVAGALMALAVSGTLVASSLPEVGPPAPQAANMRGRVSIITNPDWLRRPSREELLSVYPVRAILERVGGRATLSCAVEITTDLADCFITSEGPDFYGFGEAALSLAPFMKMKPRTVDGQPVSGARVTVPIVFTNPDYVITTSDGLALCYGVASAASGSEADLDDANSGGVALVYLGALYGDSRKRAAGPEALERLMASGRAAAAKLPRAKAKAEFLRCAADIGDAEQ